MNNNFENKPKQFFERLKKMSCSRRMNEQNEKKSNAPISTCEPNAG